MLALLSVGLLVGASAVSRASDQLVLESESAYKGHAKSSVLSKALGASTGELSDERFLASSVYKAPKSSFAPWLGRLHAKPNLPRAGVWRPAYDAEGEWLAVDLGRQFELTGLAMQGHESGDAWVKRFRIQHSTSSAEGPWKAYPHEFRANTDADGIKAIDFPTPFVARWVRILPVSWHRHIALRFELYGFSPECGALAEEGTIGVPCAKAAQEILDASMGAEEGEANLGIAVVDRKNKKGFALGIGAGLISDAAFTASSEYKPKHFFAHTDEDERCEKLHTALRAREEEAAKGEKEQEQEKEAKKASSKKADKKKDKKAKKEKNEDDQDENKDEDASSSFLELDVEAEAEAEVDVDEERLAIDAQAEADAEADAEIEEAVEDAMQTTLDSESESEGEMETETEEDAEAEGETEAESEEASSTADESMKPKKKNKKSKKVKVVVTVGKPPCGIKTSYAAHNARLGAHAQPYRSGGWRPAFDRKGEYLQMDLSSLQEVDAVATQGLAKSAFDYVTRFDLIHSTNGRVWERVASSEEDGSFTGNTDSSTAVKHVLPKPILTRYLRFVVRSWSDKGSIGLRVEAYGPGRGSGCLLKCFATNLARNSRGVDLDAALMAVNTANNAIFVHNEGESASFLETSRSEVEANANADAAVAAETTAMTTVEVLADLAVQADAEVSKLVSCCGCSCCETVDPGSCARRYRHYGSKSSSSSSSNSRQLSQRDEAALSESVRMVLRGKDGHSKKAGAHKKKVAGAVTVPDSKRTFYIVEKE